MINPVPVLWWRAVGHTHTAYATETFRDELLAAAGRDAVQGRLDLNTDGRPRDRAVLQRVADMAAWSGSGNGDRRLGVALHKSFGSYVVELEQRVSGRSDWMGTFIFGSGDCSCCYSFDDHGEQ